MPYWRLFYHLIWATQGREPLITEELEPEVWRQLRLLAEQGGAGVYAVGGVQDHAHVALTAPPSVSVAEVVRRMKGGSSHALNQLTGGGFAWQAEYGAVSFAERNLTRVVAYVENQHVHHVENKLWSTLEQIIDSEKEA